MDDTEITRYAVLAGRGDRAAAEAFVAGTQHQLSRLLGYLSNARIAEDLTQETYLRAYVALPTYGGRSPARMWLFAIARHVAADHLRMLRRRPKTFQVDDWTGVAERSGARTPDHGRLVVLRQLVDALESERREAFVLTQVLGLSYDEAATVGDCPVGTIRSRVSRAREDLTTAVAGQEVRTTVSPG
ncbi:MAG: rpoE [Amycolatopsis sp.]|uniref:sigma-70 family RNA polymerase sigma factor n=1 Tax=Amycolatopsis sp. TaxID=37632 RepID=UPI00260D5C23|nr:sigma-70 family RNA polymerase sigma factor [Amycolatopsis sp.]MCU1682644.1 rpoE [Amycolatopsis sp.]